MTLPHGRFTKRTICKKRWRMHFTVRHTTATVNGKGRSEKTYAEEPAIGTIRPANAKTLERLPEGDRVGESISIYTPAVLTPGTDTLQADIVIWNGRDYLVKDVKPYREFGFCNAIAFLIGVRG